MLTSHGGHHRGPYGHIKPLPHSSQAAFRRDLSHPDHISKALHPNVASEIIHHCDEQTWGIKFVKSYGCHLDTTDTLDARYSPPQTQCDL